MNGIVVIPARYESSRFPGKPLVELLGKSLVRRVWERCFVAMGSHAIFVATDDARILEYCQQYEMGCIMTSNKCLTGTDRVAEAIKKLDVEWAISVQCNEPLVEPEDIVQVRNALVADPNKVYCGMCPITEESEFISSTIPKVVAREDGRLLYMSRAAIPTNKNLELVRAMKQVCIYGFSRAALSYYSMAKEKAPIEKIEDIEILRFLEKTSYDVQMIEVSGSAIAVDVPEDVPKVEAALRGKNAA